MILEVYGIFKQSCFLYVMYKGVLYKVWYIFNVLTK